MTDSEQDTEKTGNQDKARHDGADQDSGEGIGDDQLPEDLQPGEDNPLAEPLDPDDEDTPDPEELDVLGGKPAEQWDDEKNAED